jgi:RNA polymerase sigma factor (sigma-70 family)
MASDASSDEPRSECRDRATCLCTAVEENHERLLHSIAVMLAYSERLQSWDHVTDLARDILDEAVQEALSHAENYDPSRSALAWIRGIAAKVILSRRREESRSRRCLSATALGEHGWEAALARLCADPPEESVGRELDLREALSQIPAVEREIIELRYYRGLDGEELARELGISSPGAARVRLCRALRALREHFPYANGEVLP